MTDIAIRPATPADVPLVLRFVRELAEYEREPDAVVATEDLLREHLFGERPYAEALIASLGGEPCGLALFFHTYSTWTGVPGLYLEDLYVTPTARGAGVGMSLMRYLAALATARGCARFEWAVLTWNEPAIKFYQRLGARHQTDWAIYRLHGEALAALASATTSPP